MSEEADRNWKRGLWTGLRPSVLPSVFSNLMLGWSLGGGIPLLLDHWLQALAVIVIALCLYGFGMWGNDFCDTAWDADHGKKGNPVNRGLISRECLGRWTGGALLVAMIVALAVFRFSNPWIYMLAACVCLYNFTHKKSALAVILMGICRGLLIMTAACAAGGLSSPLLIPAVIVLTAYVAILTWRARHEEKIPGRSLQVGQMLAMLPLMDALWLLTAGYFIPALFSMGLFQVGRWMRRLGSRAS